jgi:hypothetical protein
MPTLLPFGFSDNPEQQQPGNGAIRVERFMSLPIEVWPDSQGEVSVCTGPYRYVSGIAVGKGALHELTGHESGLCSVRVLLNIDYSVQEELFCKAGAGENAFHFKASEAERKPLSD